MRKYASLITTTVLLLMLLGFPQLSGPQEGNKAQSTDSLFEQDASNLVALFAADRFEAVAARFNSAMPARVTPATMRATWGRMSERFGRFLQVLASKQVSGSDVVNVTCVFEHGEVNVQFMFDPQSQIAGLWFQPLSGTHLSPAPDAQVSVVPAQNGIEGDWVARIGSGNLQIRYEYHLKPGGTGTLDVPPKFLGIQIHHRLEGNKVLLYGSHTFTGVLDGDHMVGFLYERGLPMVLSRKSADLSLNNDEPGSLAGYWTGTGPVEWGANVLMMFELFKDGDGFLALNLGGDSMPVRYSRKGNQISVHFGIYYAGNTAQMEYTGVLKDTSIIGTLLMPNSNPNSFALDLVRVAGPGREAHYKSQSSFQSQALPAPLPQPPVEETSGPGINPINKDPGFSFSLADYSGAQSTHLTGINDSGVVLGYYISYFPQDTIHATANYPFVVSKGQFTVLHGPIFDPISDLGSYVNTDPLAINNKGQILLSRSQWNFGEGSARSITYYLYDLNNKTFQAVGLNFRSTVSTGKKFFAGYLGGINDRGEVFGRLLSIGIDETFPFYGAPALGPAGSRVPPSAAGSFQRMPECPGGSGLLPAAINDQDQIVGVCSEPTEPGPSGFIYQGGKITLYRYPEALTTFFTGISNSGKVSGYCQLNQGLNWQAFLFDGSQFLPVVPPGSTGPALTGSMAWGVNSNGQVVGSFNEAAPPKKEHVFVASPQKPFPKP
ncbi:MAG TPA: DUF3887 domain-containing protein [Candidatus Angelobacter sp.]|jgi:uncharacterized membrane protein